MSNDTSEPATTAVNDVSGDVVLRVLASLAQKHEDFGIGVTLSVQGSLISGILIGRDAWFSAQASLLSRSGEMGAAIGGALRDGVAAAEEDAIADNEANEALDLDHYYVHLRNATIMSGSQPITSSDGPEGQGTLWRVRISEVSAWTMGNF